MTREQTIDRLKKVDDDTEHGHKQADDILCELLNFLGYDDVVAEYEKILKWYA